MQKEQDEPYKRQEIEAERAQAALQRAHTLTERVAAYRKALHSDPRIARLHLLAMSRSLEVTDSYIPLHLHQNSRPGYELDWALQERMIHPHDLLRANQRQVERWASYPLAPEQALRMYKRCVIVGAPGTGKTTLLQYLTLQAIAQQLRGLPDLPIHIALPAFARSGHRDLLAYAAAVWEARYGFPQAQALDDMQAQLQDGDALLLLDGFDETGAETTQEPAENTSHQISKAITDLASRYQQAPIVVTARKADSHQHTRLAGFTELEVRDLDLRWKETNQFVERWFASHPDPSRRGMAPEFLAQLERTARMQTLVANPLLLSLLLIVYDERRALPERRAALYDQYVEILLTQWDASRTLPRMQAFKPEHHHQLLEVVAWHFHQQRQCSFSERALLEVIAAYLPAIGFPPEQNTRVLAEIIAENGLLKEQARGWYGFVHLTFQEYFAAHFAARHQELDLLLRRRDDLWWEEVLFFYAGCIADVSLLVQHLLGLAPTHPLRDDLFHTNLILAGHCLAAADPTVRHIPLAEEVVTRLFQVLKTTRYALTQAQVAETLAGMGETTVHVQLAQMSSDEQLDSQVRQRIAAALWQSGARAIVLQLAYLLSDRRLDSGVRESIAEALGQLGERSIAPQLLQLLSDEKLDSGVRESIAEALGQLGERSIAPQLVQLLSDEQLDWPVRERIVYRLGQLGERSIAPQLVQLLADEQLNQYVRQRIAEALGQLGECSIAPQMVQLLSNEQLNQYVRGSTAVGLGQLGEPSIAPQLLQLLSDEQLDQSLRQCIAGAFGQSVDRSMVPQLLQLLSDEQLDLWVSQSIAGALGQLGERSIAPQLLQLLSDRQLDQSLRQSIAAALGRLGELSIAPQLLQLLSDRQLDQSLRGNIAEALGQLGERSMVPQLVQLLSERDLDSSVCQRIAEALGERSMVPQLVQLLSDRQLGWPVRQSIAYALGQLGERSIAPQLLQLLSDEQLGWRVRQSIAYALGQLEERSIAPQLVQLLSDEQLDWRVRERIAGALGRIGEPSIVPQLAQLLSDERLNLSLRQRIAEALSTLATDEATLQVLIALFPTSDIADSMYHLLWTMSRQMGIRIFSADRPHDTSDHMAFSIERI
jgi:HEAT repeat protein